MREMLKNTKRVAKVAADGVRAQAKKARQRSSIAVLVDAESVSAKQFPQVFESARRRGRVREVRIYGPLSLMNSEPWSIVAAAYGAKRVPCVRGESGKGGTDMRLAIDAMDLMTRKRVETFTLVGGGADLAPLARRLRAAGKYVVGVAC